MVKKTIESLHNRYKQPVPWKWRRIGDSLLCTFGTVAIVESLNDNKTVAITCWILAIVGKFLTNFFKEDYDKYYEKGQDIPCSNCGYSDCKCSPKS
jgi:hypothetical protein